MEVLLFLLGLALTVGITVGIAWYVLGPASARERSSRAHTQFMLGDLVWLVVLMQMAMAPVAAYVPRHAGSLYMIFFAFAFCGSLALWWGTMRMVSRAGVRSQLRRGAFVVVVVPLTLVIMVGWGPLCLFLLFAFAEIFTDFPYNRYSVDMVAGATVLLVSIAPILWLLRRATLWALNDPAARPREVFSETAAEEGATDSPQPLESP